MTIHADDVVNDGRVSTNGRGYHGGTGPGIVEPNAQSNQIMSCKTWMAGVGGEYFIVEKRHCGTTL